MPILCYQLVVINYDGVSFNVRIMVECRYLVLTGMLVDTLLENYCASLMHSVESFFVKTATRSQPIDYTRMFILNYSKNKSWFEHLGNDI